MNITANIAFTGKTTVTRNSITDFNAPKTIYEGNTTPAEDKEILYKLLSRLKIYLLQDPRNHVDISLVENKDNFAHFPQGILSINEDGDVLTINSGVQDRLLSVETTINRSELPDKESKTSFDFLKKMFQLKNKYTDQFGHYAEEKPLLQQIDTALTELLHHQK